MPASAILVATCFLLVPSFNAFNLPEQSVLGIRTQLESAVELRIRALLFGIARVFRNDILFF